MSRYTTIVITPDAAAKRYLLPDTEDTITALQRLTSGRVACIASALNASE